MTTVFIARGHGIQPSGRHDPGAIGNGWSEQDAADVVAPVVGRVLVRHGVDVTDEGVNDPNYVGSVAAANRAGADLFVSLHWDWTGGLDVHAFHHSGSNAGKRLAAWIVDALRQTGAPIQTNPVRARDGLYVVSKTTMPAVLVELGRIGAFGTDPTAYLTRLGVAVARGILGHLGITYDPSSSPTKDTTMAGPVPPEKTRFPDSWRWGIEIGVVGEHTKPDDTVTKDEDLELDYRREVAQERAIAAEFAALRREIAKGSGSVSQIDEAALAKRIGRRVREEIAAELLD